MDAQTNVLSSCSELVEEVGRHVFQARDLDGDGPGGHLLRAAAADSRCGSARCAVRSVLFGLAWRVRGDALPVRLRSASKVSYAATVSFPTSSFVLEARQQRQFCETQIKQ